MLNKDTNEFLVALSELINKSGLPPVNVRLALDSARAQVVELERRAVEEETRMEQEKKQQEAQE